MNLNEAIVVPYSTLFNSFSACRVAESELAAKMQIRVPRSLIWRPHEHLEIKQKLELCFSGSLAGDAGA